MSGPVVLALRALLAVSLYAFLGWAFLSLWRDIRQQAALLSARKAPPISLTTTRGDQLPRTQHFTQSEVTIGRDPACESPVEDDAVSSRHARLTYHHAQWWLEDLNSTNGTLLNHEKLAMPTVVISGDIFVCGETRFTITLAGDNLITSEKKIS
jgi:pSer/pThr/pTyr-binding forkhead associated (FHA) protein